MTLPQPDKTLRLISLLTICWSIGFLAPYTSLTREEFPIMLLIPQGLSSIFALYHLSGKATYRPFNIVVDLSLAATMIGMVIAANVVIKKEGYWGRTEWPMLGAYGCVGSIVNAVIHAYFVLREISLGNFRSSQTCPRCQYEVLCRPWSIGGGLRTPESSAASECKDSTDRQSAEVYREARPSTDDETARLV